MYATAIGLIIKGAKAEKELLAPTVTAQPSQYHHESENKAKHAAIEEATQEVQEPKEKKPGWFKRYFNIDTNSLRSWFEDDEYIDFEND